jgi:hypothetical protein
LTVQAGQKIPIQKLEKDESYCFCIGEDFIASSIFKVENGAFPYMMPSTDGDCPTYIIINKDI